MRIGDIENVSTILWQEGCVMAAGINRYGVATAGVATVAAGPLHRIQESHWVQLLNKPQESA